MADPTIHKTLIEQFHEWRELTYLTQGLHPEQYKQLRFAFFGGASSILVSLLCAAEGDEESGAARMERYMQEIQGFLGAECDAHLAKTNPANPSNG